jgi:hypothetical protein
LLFTNKNWQKILAWVAGQPTRSAGDIRKKCHNQVIKPSSSPFRKISTKFFRDKPLSPSEYNPGCFRGALSRTKEEGLKESG